MPITFFSTLPAGGNLTGADNGLTETAGVIELGGTLTKNTTIFGAGAYDVDINSVTQFSAETTPAGGSSSSLYVIPAQASMTVFGPGGASGEVIAFGGGVQLDANDGAGNSSQVELNPTSIYSNFFNVWNVTAVNTGIINQYAKIGTLQTDGGDTNGWNFNQLAIKVIMTTNGAGGSTVGFNPVQQEYDIRCDYWGANGTWQQFTPIERQGLGSNSVYTVSLQGLYTNAANNSANLQLRLINTSASISIGWNISIYVLRPQFGCFFTPQTGTGTDATGYPVYQSIFGIDYILNQIVVSKPFVKSYNNPVQFNLPNTNGASGNTLVSDGLGNTSWQMVSPNIVGNSFNSVTTASQNLILYAVLVTKMFRCNVTCAILSGTGTVAITVTYTNYGNVSVTSTFYSQGSTTGVLSGVGTASFPPMVIYAKSGANISIDCVITGTVSAAIGTTIETFS
jgi:hypothetical protein